MDAGVSLGLSGPDALHAGHAARGLALWASDEDVELQVEDDGGSAEVAALNYGRFVDRGVDVLLGPYGSGMVRRLAPLVCDRGRVLWNHGGSADDLARPNLVSVTAPSSTYFEEPIEVALSEGVTGAVFVHGRGRFGRAVARGGEEVARGLGMEARVVDTGTWRQQGWQPPTRWAVLFSSTFDDDVELVREASRRPAPVGLVGCVAAGIDAFGDRLGELAEGVVGPAQWFPDASEPDVGPSGGDFARRFEEGHG
ncbi:MAG: ABC transporter substrate-binding protein, partial [Actinomycetota bacterium]|nr:ABC transporter substrate-binding protein [Actinomycetota bacterium]